MARSTTSANDDHHRLTRGAGAGACRFIHRERPARLSWSSPPRRRSSAGFLPADRRFRLSIPIKVLLPAVWEEELLIPIMDKSEILYWACRSTVRAMRAPTTLQEKQPHYVAVSAVRRASRARGLRKPVFCSITVIRNDPFGEAPRCRNAPGPLCARDDAARLHPCKIPIVLRMQTHPPRA